MRCCRRRGRCDVPDGEASESFGEEAEHLLAHVGGWIGAQHAEEPAEDGVVLERAEIDQIVERVEA